jgi:CRP/FNR family transcriptional regulator, cyclic AMP receptor protein
MGSDTLFHRYGREFPEGHILFREGDVGTVMYWIHTGNVQLTRKFSLGDRTLAVLGTGDFFGEMALLSQRPRSATALCLEPLRVIEMDKKRLDEMMVSNPEIAQRVMVRLGRRIEAANEMAEILSHRDPRIRVVWALTRLSEEFNTGAPGSVALPFTIADIACTANVSEEETARLIQRLERAHIIAAAGKDGYSVVSTSTLRDFLVALDREVRAGMGALPVPAHGAEAHGGRV